jgi:hypothetical protein
VCEAIGPTDQICDLLVRYYEWICIGTKVHVLSSLTFGHRIFVSTSDYKYSGLGFGFSLPLLTSKNHDVEVGEEMVNKWKVKIFWDDVGHRLVSHFSPACPSACCAPSASGEGSRPTVCCQVSTFRQSLPVHRDHRPTL